MLRLQPDGLSEQAAVPGRLSIGLGEQCFLDSFGSFLFSGSCECYLSIWGAAQPQFSMSVLTESSVNSQSCGSHVLVCLVHLGTTGDDWTQFKGTC